MMSALHLIWIIPASAWFGFALAALMVVAKDERKEGDG